MRETFWARYKDLLVPTLVAALAFFGGLLGAQVQLPINVRLEQQKTLLELRREAYSDFFEGQARGFIVRGPDEMEASYENRIRVAKSKLFVAVFSAYPVADAMAHYFLTYLPHAPCAGTQSKFQADVQMYREMRQELFEDEREQLSDENMTVLLFDCLLPPAAPNAAGGLNP